MLAHRILPVAVQVAQNDIEVVAVQRTKLTPDRSQFFGPRLRGERTTRVAVRTARVAVKAGQARRGVLPTEDAQAFRNQRQRVDKTLHHGAVVFDEALAKFEPAARSQFDAGHVGDDTRGEVHAGAKRNRGTRYTGPRQAAMKRIVVTGANKGIGRAVVEAILGQHRDTVVLLGSRNEARGAATRDAIAAAHPELGERVQRLIIDVASDDSVAAAAADVAQRWPNEPTPLYGVVNNAGIGVGAADLEPVLQVNTLGVRRVCEAFVPLITRDAGRVVNVTSASGPSYVAGCGQARQRMLIDPAITSAQLQSLIDECLALDGAEAFEAAGLGTGQPYGLSKALANAYTSILARDNPGLHINACTPGFIATDLTRPYAEGSGKTAAEMGMKPPEEGTRSILFLLFEALEGNGRYYGSDAVRSPMDRYRAPGTPAYAPD